MKMTKFGLSLGAALAAMMVLAGCGGSGDDASPAPVGKAGVRGVHVAPGTSNTNVYIDGKLAASGLAYLDSSLVEITPGYHTISFRTASGATLDSTGLMIGDGQVADIAVTGQPGSVAAVANVAASDAPVLLHAAPSAGAVNVMCGDSSITGLKFQDYYTLSTSGQVVVTKGDGSIVLRGDIPATAKLSVIAHDTDTGMPKIVSF